MFYGELNQSFHRTNTVIPNWIIPWQEFYGTAKIHKLSPGDQIEKLPIRPIISNIDTATYRLAKHLAKLLSPLSASEYTVKSTRLYRKIKNSYEMVSNGIF